LKEKSQHQKLQELEKLQKTLKKDLAKSLLSVRSKLVETKKEAQMKLEKKEAQLRKSEYEAKRKQKEAKILLEMKEKEA
jgi:hypothetical protein